MLLVEALALNKCLLGQMKYIDLIVNMITWHLQTKCFLTSFISFHVSLYNLVSLFPSKYPYKIVKKKLLISIKHDLIIGRDIPETRRQKILTKNLD